MPELERLRGKGKAKRSFGTKMRSFTHFLAFPLQKPRQHIASSSARIFGSLNAPFPLNSFLFLSSPRKNRGFGTTIFYAGDFLQYIVARA